MKLNMQVQSAREIQKSVLNGNAALSQKLVYRGNNAKTSKVVQFFLDEITNVLGDQI